VSKRAKQTHGKVVHALNDHEAVVWDTTEIRPEVKERFDRALALRITANNKVLKRLGLAKGTPSGRDEPSAGQVA
jgi:hypothetical protein